MKSEMKYWMVEVTPNTMPQKYYHKMPFGHKKYYSAASFNFQELDSC